MNNSYNDGNNSDKEALKDVVKDVEKMLEDLTKVVGDVKHLKDWKNSIELAALELSDGLESHIDAIRRVLPIPPIQRLASWVKTQLERLRQHTRQNEKNENR